MRKGKILRGAIVLLIAAAMVFSTVAVTADTTNTPQAHLDEQNSPQSFIQTNPPTINRALIWDNGDPDFVNGLCCQRIGSVTLCDTADDFHLAKKSVIETVVWESVDDTTYIWEGFDDLIVYEYTPTGPGAEIVTLLQIDNTREYLGEQFGRPWYRYTIDLIGQGQEFTLEAGDYYILLRPYTASIVGQSFWLTSPAPAGSTSESYFRGEYFGYPEWTPCTTVFGEPFDVNFKLYGVEKTSREINRPFQQFLESHPNLFSILRLLLQRLEL